MDRLYRIQLFRPTQFHGKLDTKSRISLSFRHLRSNISLYEDCTGCDKPIDRCIDCANVFSSPFDHKDSQNASKVTHLGRSRTRRRHHETKSQERCKSRCSHSIYRQDGNYRRGTGKKSRRSTLNLYQLLGSLDHPCCSTNRQVEKETN